KPNQYTEYFQNGQRIFSVLLDIKDEINPLYLTEDYAKTSDLINRNVLYEALKTKSKTPKEALDKAAAEVKGQ
ncbi:arabinose-binding protein, partial [Bacillus haynesii]|nr:arabinose-binding protein [Bacillus haynesii]